MLYPTLLSAEDRQRLSKYDTLWQIIRGGRAYTRRLRGDAVEAALDELFAAPLCLGGANRGMLYGPFMGLGRVEDHAKVLTLLHEAEPSYAELRWFQHTLNLPLWHINMRHPEVNQIRLPLSYEDIGELEELGGFVVEPQGLSCLLRRGPAAP